MYLWYLRKSCGFVAITFCYVRETKMTISLSKSSWFLYQDKYIHLGFLGSILGGNFKHYSEQ